jgi:hypothetical protein
MFGGLYPGDGQKMGLWVGAAWQRTYPNAPMIDSLGPAPYTQSVANHTGINLNSEGQRYMNEDTIFSYSCLALMNNTNMTAYYVWDTDYHKWFDHWYTFGCTIEQTGGPKGMTPEQQLASWDASAENGLYVKGDTIDEVLAKLDGLDAATAKATIERYNGYCASGVDEEYHKNKAYLAPIKTGPFMVASLPQIHQTFSALPAGFVPMIECRFARKTIPQLTVSITSVSWWVTCMRIVITLAFADTILVRPAILLPIC